MLSSGTVEYNIYTELSSMSAKACDQLGFVAEIKAFCAATGLKSYTHG